MAVYDFCSFLNENDLYEIRLNQHWDFVDKFIVVEAGETHTGIRKPLRFDHKRFESYKSKIHYVTFDNFEDEMKKYPELFENISTSIGPNSERKDWVRCYFQDNYLVKILKDLEAKDDDIVYSSCLDEIIKVEAFNQGLERFKDKDTLYAHNLRPIFFFHLYLYAYKVNLLHRHWSKHVFSWMTEVGNFKKILPSSYRDKLIFTHPPIPDAGWHFTFLDNTDGEMVLEKQRSWAHSRDKYPGKKVKFDHITKEEAVQRFFEDYEVTLVDITEGTHPKYLIDNLDKFKNLIYKETK